jgi:hypothetical protein
MVLSSHTEDLFSHSPLIKLTGNAKRYNRCDWLIFNHYREEAGLGTSDWTKLKVTQHLLYMIVYI